MVSKPYSENHWTKLYYDNIQSSNPSDLTVMFGFFFSFSLILISIVDQLDILLHVIVALTLGSILVEQKLFRTLLVTVAKGKKKRQKTH